MPRSRAHCRACSCAAADAAHLHASHVFATVLSLSLSLRGAVELKAEAASLGTSPGMLLLLLLNDTAVSGTTSTSARAICISSCGSPV